MDKKKIMNRLEENYNTVKDMEYETIGVFLQGSQNYNLDYEDSDIDCKAIILPKFKDFLLNSKPISTTHVLENNEHIDLKDIRLMFDCFKKQNINFIEILFTEYIVFNPAYEKIFKPLIDIREYVARYNNYASLNCMCGMIMEKHKALEHPYPATMDKIEKFGYDPKQLHHLIRLEEFIERYISGEPYSECLISKNTEYLIDVKKGRHNLDEAREIANKILKKSGEVKSKYMNDNEVCINKNVENVLNDVLYNCMSKNFKLELGV